MAELDKIVEITLTRASTPVETASFQIVMVLAEFATTVFTERTRTYTDIEAVAEDFVSTDEAYIIAQKLFGQSTVGAKPASIIIGRKSSDPLLPETWVEALTACSNENDTWYALVAATHVAADVEALSDAVNARRKIFGTSTQDATTITTGITDIAHKLSAKLADRTFGVYLPTADDEYPEAAWIGSQLSYTPGSNDWDKKRAVGVTRSNINDTARVNLRNKNCNMYTRVAGVNIFQDGDTFGGSPIDEIIGIDWLYARLQEGVYFRMINTLKIPMTNRGLAIIESEIRSVLAQAEANGLIDAGWKVTVPDVLDIPENLRAQRIAGAFRFDARLAGSIRRVQINGFLSV